MMKNSDIERPLRLGALSSIGQGMLIKVAPSVGLVPFTLHFNQVHQTA